MRVPSGVNDPAVRAIGGRPIAASALVVCACLLLGSCASGASEDGFSAYVADHWPHWAGGMPDDVPPRPGAPGYRQFIAHGQADQDQLPRAAGATPVFQTAPAAPGQSTRAAAATQGAPAAPAAAEAPAISDAQAASAEQAAPQPVGDDSSVVRGGLY